MVVPFLGVVFGAGTFLVLTTIAHVSSTVALQRQRSGEPLSRWEKTVPVTLALVTIAVLVLAVGLALVFGWTVTAIADRMRAS
jgi:hypothetical protein